MIYRRHPFFRRKYMYATPTADVAANIPTIPEDKIDAATEKIPLPNEIESESESDKNQSEEDRYGGSLGLPSIFKNLKIDDIILIAVIFLLLYEGVPDEILLILLVYLLIT